MTGRMIITRADEAADRVAQGGIVAVLSIEHPGAVEGGKGAAPRLSGVTQKILTFWDSETPVVQGPDRAMVEEGVQFILDHIETGDVLIHCHAGKARSAAMALGGLALIHTDKSADDLVKMLAEMRPVAAPNILVVAFADDIAGRGGALVAAVERHGVFAENRRRAELSRQRQLEKDPSLWKKLYPEKFPPKP